LHGRNAKWKEKEESDTARSSGEEVKRMNACDNIVKLSRRVGVHRRLLYKWRDDLEKLHRQAESDILVLNSRETALRRELNRIKRLLAEKTVEVDFLTAPTPL
jgi:transposase-like protein